MFLNTNWKLQAAKLARCSAIALIAAATPASRRSSSQGRKVCDRVIQSRMPTQNGV
jgi:hypothetical protein